MTINGPMLLASYNRLRKAVMKLSYYLSIINIREIDSCELVIGWYLMTCHAELDHLHVKRIPCSGEQLLKNVRLGSFKSLQACLGTPCHRRR